MEMKEGFQVFPLSPAGSAGEDGRDILFSEHVEKKAAHLLL